MLVGNIHTPAAMEDHIIIVGVCEVARAMNSR